MSDQMLLFNQFATAVAAALNAGKVVPPDDESKLIYALIAMVGKPGAEAPVGGSLNFDKERRMWEVTPQMIEAELYQEPEAGHA